jgi:hypothetical protein
LSNTSSIKVDFLIPLFYNDGTEIEDEHFAFIHDELINHFGGYTQSTTPDEGVWRNQDGRTFHDIHKSVMVVCDKTQENIAFLRQLKKQLEELLHQESIFMTITNNVTIL